MKTGPTRFFSLNDRKHRGDRGGSEICLNVRKKLTFLFNVYPYLFGISFKYSVLINQGLYKFSLHDVV